MIDGERKMRAIKESQEIFARAISVDNRTFRCEVTGYDGVHFEVKFMQEGIKLTKKIPKEPLLDCHPRVKKCFELRNILDGIEKKIAPKGCRKNERRN